MRFREKYKSNSTECVIWWNNGSQRNDDLLESSILEHCKRLQRRTSFINVIPLKCVVFLLMTSEYLIRNPIHIVDK